MADTQINTTSGMRAAGIVALSSGGHAVIMTGPGADSTTDVLMRRFDTDGNPVGGVTVVNTVTAGSQTQVEVAHLANGGFVVTWWSVPPAPGTGGTPRYQIYDASGAAVGSEGTVPFTGTNARPLNVQGLADGSFVLAYRVSAPTGDAGVFLALYDSAGGFVSQASATSINTVFMAELQSGGFALITMASQDFAYSLRSEIYTVSGGVMASAGPSTQVQATPYGNFPSGDVIALADGSYVVAWTANVTGDNDIYLRKYSASGVPLTGEILVNTTTALPQYTPQMTRLADGGFFIAWTSGNQVSPTSGNDLYGQRFDASGAKIGSEVLLSETTASDQLFHNIGLAGDGSLILIWSNGPVGSADVYQAHFDIVTGTAGNDIFAGTAGRDLIYAQGGDDFIDILASGSDVVFGGAGNDSFQVRSPGAYTVGATTLQGEDGDDSFLLNDDYGGFAYTIVGGAGRDYAGFQSAGASTADMGDGDDRVSVTRGQLSVTLGAGHDRIELGNNDPQLHVRVADFQMSGASSDTLDFTNYLLNAYPGLAETANPFAEGYVRLVQSGADTEVQIKDGVGFRTIATFTNVTAGTVTAASLGGYDPAGGANVGLNVTGDGTEEDFFGLTGPNVVDGGGGRDRIYGGRGYDQLSGGDGNDLIRDEAGASAIINGGAGADELYIVRQLTTTVAGTIVVHGDGGADFITGAIYNPIYEPGAIAIHGDDGDDRIYFSGPRGVHFFGGAGNDIIEAGAGDDLLDGGDGDDVLTGGAGTDTASYASAASGVTVNLKLTTAQNTRAAGTDTLIDIENVIGSAFNDIFTAGAGANDIFGGDGSDNFSSGGAGDRLYGGAGNDFYNLESADALVIENAGEGMDEVVTSFSYTLAANVENFRLLSTGGAGYGYGNELNNFLAGNEFDNHLVGGAGDDILQGRGGSNILDGGDGNDTAHYGIPNGVSVTLSSAPVSGPGVVQTDTFISIENLTGSIFDDTLKGDGGANILTGQAGADTLYGEGGADTLNGGEGDDTLDGGAGDDTLDGGAGTDTASYASASSGVTVSLQATGAQATGGAGADTLIGIETLTGSEHDDTLTAAIGGSILMGLGGRDTLNGAAGDDTLDGGDGDDLIEGGAGNDALRGGGGNDTVSYANAAARPTGPAGLGVFVSLANTAAQNTAAAGTDTLSGFENLIGSAFNDNLVGDAGANLIMGGAGSDVIDGGAGADHLHGGLGSDQFYVDSQDDLVFELASQGTDTITSTVSFYLYGNIENLTLASGAAGALYGVGNDLGNVIVGNNYGNLLIGWGGSDQLDGEGGNDQLWGGDGNDGLRGGSGDDLLVGGDGDDLVDGDTSSSPGEQDLLHGGAGDDRYTVGSQNDIIFENPGEGTDSVTVYMNGGGYYLYPNLENLTLGNREGAWATFGVGNAQANVMTGNTRANWLLGGAGDDTLDGAGGNDVLFGEAGADTFVFQRGTKGDVIGDFQQGADKIKLVGIGYEWQDVQNSLHQNGDHTAIDLGQGDFIVVHNVAMSAFTANDFIF